MISHYKKASPLGNDDREEAENGEDVSTESMWADEMKSIVI